MLQHDESDQRAAGISEFSDRLAVAPHRIELHIRWTGQAQSAAGTGARLQTGERSQLRDFPIALQPPPGIKLVLLDALMSEQPFQAVDIEILAWHFVGVFPRLLVARLA